MGKVMPSAGTDPSWFAALAEASLDALVVLVPVETDGLPDYECLYANPAMGVLVGTDAAALVGRRIREAIRPRHGTFRRDLAEVVTTGRAIRREIDVDIDVIKPERIEYQITPVDSWLAVSIADRTGYRDLEHQVGRLESAFDIASASSFDACFVLRPIYDSGRIIDFVFERANERAGLLLSQPPEALVGSRTFDLFPRDPQFCELVEQCVASGATITMDLDLRGRPFEADWIRVGVTAFFDAVIVHAEDISAARREKQQLHESEVRYKSLFETLGEGVILTDLDGVIRLANPAYARLVGCEVIDLVGRQSTEFVHESGLDAVRQRRADLLLGSGSDGRGRVRSQRSDGSTFWCSFSGALLRRDDGPAWGLMGTILDIDAEVKAEEALRVSETRLRAIVESSDEAIMLLDADLSVEYCNAVAATVLGRNISELVGRRLESLSIAVEPNDAYELLASLKAGEIDRARGLLRLSGPAETVRTIFGSAVAVRGANAEFGGVVLVGTDITQDLVGEEQRLELLAALAMAEQDERANLAVELHDGPVQTLAALSLRLGASIEIDTDPPEFITTAERAVRETIHQLRTLMFRLSPPDFERDALDSVVRERAAVLFEGTDTEVVVEGRFERAPNSVVRLALFRIIQEGLVNARKHAEAAHVSVTFTETGTDYCVVVTDDGRGFPPLEGLRVVPGHLGARTMLQRADQLGGTCRFEAAAGAGTEVQIEIPKAATGALPSLGIASPTAPRVA